MSAATFTRAAALAATTALLGLAPSSRAALVAVYRAPGGGSSMEAMRALAQSVLARRAVADGSAIEAPPAGDDLSLKVTDKAVLTSELSVPVGASAFFLADEPLVYESFEMAGESAQFEVALASESSAPEALAKEALPLTPAVRTYPTALNVAAMSQGGLRVGYSVSRPGRVEVEAVGLNGQRFGAWSVFETAAGNYNRVFPVNQASKGPFYVRWSHGDVRAVWKVGPAPQQ